MVELALEGAQALVEETADVPPVQKLLPLGVDDRAPQPDGRLALRGHRDLARLGGLVQVQSPAVAGQARREVSPWPTRLASTVSTVRRFRRMAISGASSAAL